ncbi:MAG: hypothetical protein ACN4GR_14875, partial [Arenicellales bacterium]
PARLCTVVKIATSITTNKLNKTTTYILKFKLRIRRSGVRIAPGAPYISSKNKRLSGYPVAVLTLKRAMRAK